MSFTYLGACLFYLRVCVTDALGIGEKKHRFVLTTGNSGRNRKGREGVVCGYR
jgi:hypothetical protein